MWVFGYGSLMWDRWEKTKVTGCLSSQLATLKGYTRSFSRKSTRNWGTPFAPGPTLGLEPSADASCVGMAFEFPDAGREEVEGYLRVREGSSFTLTELSATLSDGRTLPVLVALDDQTAKTYIGNLPLDERLRMARVANGTSGSCADYVRDVRDKLKVLGIADPRVEEFAEKLG